MAELEETDLVLGVVSEAGYVNRSLQLDPGDALVLFTDGVTDAENPAGDDLGSRRLVTRLARLHGATADDITATIEREVLAHIGDATVADDVTLMVVSRNRAVVSS